MPMEVGACKSIRLKEMFSLHAIRDSGALGDTKLNSALFIQIGRLFR